MKGQILKNDVFPEVGDDPEVDAAIEQLFATYLEVDTQVVNPTIPELVDPVIPSTTIPVPMISKSSKKARVVKHINNVASRSSSDKLKQRDQKSS